MVPWWAVWPFETLVLAKKHVGSLPEFSMRRGTALAAILKQHHDALRQSLRDEFSLYDGLSPDAERWRGASGVAFPRALLSAAATVGYGEKFMVGFEMLGMPQRDITPEGAAERLRVLPDLHFTLKT